MFREEIVRPLSIRESLACLDNLLENTLSAAGLLRVDVVNRPVWNIYTNIVGSGIFLRGV